MVVTYCVLTYQDILYVLNAREEVSKKRFI
jgi:hypothetical protein